MHLLSTVLSYYGPILQQICCSSGVAIGKGSSPQEYGYCQYRLFYTKTENYARNILERVPIRNIVDKLHKLPWLRGLVFLAWKPNELQEKVDQGRNAEEDHRPAELTHTLLFSFFLCPGLLGLLLFGLVYGLDALKAFVVVI
jgi:hypothetical protein